MVTIDNQSTNNRLILVQSEFDLYQTSAINMQGPGKDGVHCVHGNDVGLVAFAIFVQKKDRFTCIIF